MPSKIERCAIYIRVSTAEQMMHGKSLEAQKQYLTNYAKEHNLSYNGVKKFREVVEIFDVKFVIDNN